MASSLESAITFSASGSNESIKKCTLRGYFSFGSSVGNLQFGQSRSNEVFGKCHWNVKSPSHFSVNPQSSICVTKSMRWWEKTLKSNMVEIHSAQELVDYLLNAEDRLVIIDFYSPGCGGCKTLHPKICQIAERNANAIFVKVNYDEMRSMCQSLHIHVLPFFRFYRGAEGKLCSFSCTNATIKKFKDALVKYGGPARSTVGPAKGLDDSELLALFSTGQLPKNYAPSNKVEYFAKEEMDLYSPINGDNKLGLEESNVFAVASLNCRLVLLEDFWS